jgi:Aspartyl protease
MHRRIALPWFVFAVALVARGSLAEQQPEPMRLPSGVMQMPKGGVTVPMESMGGRPEVDVQINGRGPYRFILDFGATTTLVDPAVAQELSLSAAEGLRVAAAGPGPAPTIVLARELRIGEATVTNCALAVMPVRLRGGDNGPAGILSASSFPGYVLGLNYPEKTITLVSGSLREADEKSIFQYSEAEVLPTVPVRVAGHIARVHVDTGSPFGLTLPTRFLSKLPLEAPPIVGHPVRTRAGEFPVSIGRVRGDISVGSLALDVRDVSFSDARPSPALAAGNLGFEVLEHLVVTLDSKNRRIELRRP